MTLHVLKFPDAETVATVREVPDGTPPPESPWEVMTPAEYAAFVAPFAVVHDDGAPAFDPATETVDDGGVEIQPTRRARKWIKRALTAAELETNADAIERADIKAMREQIATDIQESIADQAQAQAYIDLAAPTNAERNQEIQNSARRDKAAEQRFRRLARISRYLLKAL